jgi:hypothetical protein
VGISAAPRELGPREHNVAKQSPRIKRFARYHTGGQTAALASLWQTEAEFEVQLHLETKSLVFTYSFPAPVNIPLDCEGLYDALFSVYRVELEKRLRDALKSLKSGRPVSTYIDNFHHRAIQDGISGWLRELYRTNPALIEKAQEQINDFALLSPKRSGPDAQLALIVRERVLQVLESVKLLRKNVNPNWLELSDENALVKEIEKSGLRVEAVRGALQELFKDEHWTSVKALFGDSFTPIVMTHSIVLSELASDKRNPLKISVRTYVRKAKQLLNAMRAPIQSEVTPDKKS